MQKLWQKMDWKIRNASIKILYKKDKLVNKKVDNEKNFNNYNINNYDNWMAFFIFVLIAYIIYKIIKKNSA